MAWSVIAAFGALLCWGFGDFLIQRSVRRIGDIESLAWIGIVGIVGLLPFVIHDFLLVTPKQVILLISLSLITFVSALMNFEALKRGKLSVIEIVMTLELPLTVMLAIVLFNERLSILQGSAIGLVFLGVVLIATENLSYFKKMKNFFEKGVILAAFAALAMGLTNFLTGAGAKSISPLLVIFVPWVVFTALCFFVIETRREGVRKFSHHWKNYRSLVLFMGLFDTAAWLLYAFALVGGALSITTALTESYPAVALFFGVWINRERLGWHQYLGALLAIGASVGLAMSV